jgi:hypothetical protein
MNCDVDDINTALLSSLLLFLTPTPTSWRLSENRAESYNVLLALGSCVSPKLSLGGSYESPAGIGLRNYDNLHR